MNKKTITIKSAPLFQILTSLNGEEIKKEPFFKNTVDTLATFIADNWKEIGFERLQEINKHAVHCEDANDLCRCYNVKKVSDLYKSHVVLPIVKGGNKDYLVINRKALGQKGNGKLNIKLSNEDADTILFRKMDEIVEKILKGKYRGASRQPLTYKWICVRWNMPSFREFVKMQGFTPRRFFNELLPSALERYGKAHPDFVQAIIDKNGKRWAKKSDLQEFVDRFGERIGNACSYDYDLRNARYREQH